MNITNYYRVLLQLILEKKLYTTFSTRTLFMFSSIIYNGLSYVFTLKNTDGYIPSFFLEIDQQYFINYVEHIHMLGISLLNTTFNSKILFDFINLQASILLHNDKYKDFKNMYESELQTIENEIYDYYITRDEDGWRDSNEQIITPNYKHNIKLNEELNLNLGDSKSWTLIENQFMTGSKWGDIKNLISHKVVELIEEFAKNQYTSINFIQETNRFIDSIKNISEEKKIIIKFFDELTEKITVSGILNFFLLSYFENNQVELVDQIKFLHILNTGLFVSSIIIYKIKYTILDPYPIQIIRQNFIPDFIPETTYTDDLCTPPFISKDVGLISIGSEILKSIIGNDIENLNILLNGYDLIEISSFYNQDFNNLKINLSNIIIPINNTQLKQELSLDHLELPIKNWDELIEYIWMIRYLGGIESSYSNNYGIIIGKEITNYIFELF